MKTLVYNKQRSQLAMLIRKYGADAQVAVVQGTERELNKLFPMRQA